MSDKRPETDADILSRSRKLSGLAVGGLPGGLSGAARRRKNYSVDLPAHMAECDANYHRLMRLFPNLREDEQREFTLPLAAMQALVVFEVVEKGPYTTLLQLDVRGDEQWLKLAAAPSMQIRVYHDAQSAEVVRYQSQNRFHSSYEYPNQRMRQRDEKVQLNRFLSEFLNLCLEHGASTTPISF